MGIVGFGAVQEMLRSIKSNQRKKRSTIFDKDVESSKETFEGYTFDHKTKDDLNTYKKRYYKEEKAYKTRLYLIYLLVATTVIAVVGFTLFG